MKRFFTLLAACGFALSAQSACYIVYKADRLIYQSSQPPVDTRYQYHATVPQRFGQGSTLIYLSNNDNCSSIGTLVQVVEPGPGSRDAMIGRRTRPLKAERG
jgi:hypothetical protein